MKSFVVLGRSHLLDQEEVSVSFLLFVFIYPSLFICAVELSRWPGPELDQQGPDPNVDLHLDRCWLRF